MRTCSNVLIYSSNLVFSLPSSRLLLAALYLVISLIHFSDFVNLGNIFYPIFVEGNTTKLSFSKSPLLDSVIELSATIDSKQHGINGNT